MTVTGPSWDNSTFSGNTTTIDPNATLWVIPPKPGRSLQADVVACAVITFLIASSFVVLRFYTRGRLNHVLGASDWCILPALLCAAGVTASSLEQMVHGAGRHAWEIDVFQLPAFERAAWYGIFFYNLSLTLTRISILLLYKRIFTYTWTKRAIRIVLVLVIAIGIWFVVSVCTACMPLQAFWDWSLYWTTFVYCQPPNLWWANAALHIASDFVVMALPMPVLSSLSLPKRQKYAVVGVFALGFFVCIISIVRLVALIQQTEQQNWDATYTSAGLIYWTTVEVNAAISCACIMTLKPLIQRIFPRLLSPSKCMREPTLQWITTINNQDSTTTTTTNNNTTNNTSNTNPHHRNSQHQHYFATALRHLDNTQQRRPSDTPSTTKTRRGSNSGLLQHAHAHAHDQDQLDQMEKSRYYHGVIKPSLSPGGEYDLDHDLDLEAQRTCSVASTSSHEQPHDDDDDDDDSPLGPVTTSNSSFGGGIVAGGEGLGGLRLPPRAHLAAAAAAAGGGGGGGGGLTIRVTKEVVVQKWPRSSLASSGGQSYGEPEVELREGVGVKKVAS